MQGILDNLPVAAMFLIENWALVLLVIALPLVLLAMSARAGNWGHPRRRRAALAGLAIGAVLGPLLAFAAIGGGWADLHYWLDWALLIVIAGASAAYAALLAYLAMAPG